MLIVRSLGVADFEKEPKLEKCDRRKIVAVGKEGIYNSNPDAAPVCHINIYRWRPQAFSQPPRDKGVKAPSRVSDLTYIHTLSPMWGRTLGAARWGPSHKHALGP